MAILPAWWAVAYLEGGPPPPSTKIFFRIFSYAVFRQTTCSVHLPRNPDG